MRILIITRSFPPDSGIATIRPAKFAKYLSELGHDVTVIRSGLIFGVASIENSKGLENVRILSYEGVNSPAERFERGEQLSKVRKAVAESGAQKSLMKELKSWLHPLYDTLKFYYSDGWVISGKIRKTIKAHLRNEHFDVVISSFSPVGCHFAGKFAARYFKCKWVADFRDVMDRSTLAYFNRKLYYQTQVRLVNKADMCLCVSEGNAKKLRYKAETPVHVIPNGYTIDADPLPPAAEPERLSFCYTGTFYEGFQDIQPLLKAIKKEIKVPFGSVVLRYAGYKGAYLISEAKKEGLDMLVDDNGYLSRKESSALQNGSDLFLVLAWNSNIEQGGISGKFYEALTHRKPVVALVAGNVPNSELRQMIEGYGLGVCYEEADHDNTFPKLCEYIKIQYGRKKNGLPMYYEPDEAVFETFRYDTITKRLEKILIALLSDNKKRLS